MKKLLEQKLFIKLRDDHVFEEKEDLIKFQKTHPEKYKEWRNKQKIPVQTNWTTNKDVLKTWKEAEKWNNVGMVIPKGFVVLDVDNKVFAERIERLLNDYKIVCAKSQTANGKHFLFKQPKKTIKQTQKWPLRIGVEGDIRASGKGQIAVKFHPDSAVLNNDGVRFYETPDMEQIDIFPDFLLPLNSRYYGQKADKLREIIDLKWAKGIRDETFRDWTTQFLYLENMSKKECVNQTKLIDQYISHQDYTHFKSPHEIEYKVERWYKWAQENIKKPRVEELEEKINSNQARVSFAEFNTNFREEKDVDYWHMSEFICKKYRITFFQGSFWIGEKEYPWSRVTSFKEIEIKIIGLAKNEYSKLNVNVLEKILTSVAKKEESDDNHLLINFKNGRYHLRTKQLIPYEGGEFLTFGLPYDYKDHGKNEVVDKFFNNWGQDNQDIVDTLYRFIGLTLYDKNDFAKALFLYGIKANNGKSSFMRFIREKIMGSKYSITISLSELEKTHGTANLPGKKILVLDEIQSKSLNSSEVFKTMITGQNPISINRKFKDEFNIIPTQKVIGSMNSFPKVADKSEGFLRRICILPFDKIFTEADNKWFANNKDVLYSQEGVEYVLFKAIKQLVEMYEHKTFKEPEIALKIKQTIKANNSNVYQWFKEKESNIETYFLGKTLQECYASFKEYCYDVGINVKQPMGDFKMELETTTRGKYYFSGSTSKAHLEKLSPTGEKIKDKIDDKEFLKSLFGNKIKTE